MVAIDAKCLGNIFFWKNNKFMINVSEWFHKPWQFFGFSSLHLFSILYCSLSSASKSSLLWMSRLRALLSCFKLALSSLCSSGWIWACNPSALASQAAGIAGLPTRLSDHLTLATHLYLRRSRRYQKFEKQKTKIKQEDSSWFIALALIVFFPSLSKILTRVNVNIVSLSSVAPCNLVPLWITLLKLLWLGRGSAHL